MSFTKIHNMYRSQKALFMSCNILWWIADKRRGFAVL
jgi:hypothetical protein